MKHKSIDINQRIPLNTLHVGLEGFIHGSYDEEYILEQLRLEFTGENRLRKSIRIVNKIISENPLSEYLFENKTEVENALKLKNDRNVILISLLNSAFVFSFDTLQLLGKFFSVQDLVNRQVIKKSLASIYGGNRATDNAIDSVIPMFIEAGLLLRPKLGVYQRNTDLNISSSISGEAYMKSFEVHNHFERLNEFQLRDPYFQFLDN